jgi:DNA-binding XRE family transcriptional regulator
LCWCGVPFNLLIKEYRRERGLSQEALAEQLAVEPATVGRWERGATKPDAATQASILGLLRPRSGMDWPLRLMIESTPALMQLFLPDTKILAASPGFGALQKMSGADMAGRLDVHDFTPAMLVEHERHGGVEAVLRAAALSAGYHPWLASAPTNNTGRDLLLSFVSRRIMLDDGTYAILSTSTIVDDLIPDAPFRVVWE